MRRGQARTGPSTQASLVVVVPGAADAAMTTAIAATTSGHPGVAAERGRERDHGEEAGDHPIGAGVEQASPPRASRAGEARPSRRRKTESGRSSRECRMSPISAHRFAGLLHAPDLPLGSGSLMPTPFEANTEELDGPVHKISVVGELDLDTAPCSRRSFGPRAMRTTHRFSSTSPNASSSTPAGSR